MAAPLGNKNATKSKAWEAAVRRHFTQNPEKLAKIAETVAKAAEAGESWAVQEIGNRLDGKPVQQVEMQQTLTTALANELTNEQLAHVVATGRLPGADTHDSIN